MIIIIIFITLPVDYYITGRFITLLVDYYITGRFITLLVDYYITGRFITLLVDYYITGRFITLLVDYYITGRFITLPVVTSITYALVSRRRRYDVCFGATKSSQRRQPSRAQLTRQNDGSDTNITTSQPIYMIVN